MTGVKRGFFFLLLRLDFVRFAFHLLRQYTGKAGVDDRAWNCTTDSTLKVAQKLKS